MRTDRNNDDTGWWPNDDDDDEPPLSNPADTRFPTLLPSGGPSIGVKMPMRWFRAAARLPGKASLIGVLLWHWALPKRGSVIQFRLQQARAAGLGRNAAYRGLKALETAGLIAVTRRPGLAAQIAILDVPNPLRRQHRSSR